MARKLLSPGAFEYTPRYVLWSDGVDKRRWLVLPGNETIDTQDMDHWDFPVGTRIFKEFSEHGQIFETRLIERVADTGRIKEDYQLATFVWNQDQTAAELTTGGVLNVFGREHDVPAQKYCLVCHRGEPGTILGFSALQLSPRDMERAVDTGMLSDPPLHPIEIPGNALTREAIGVLHANCGHCHAPTGTAEFMTLQVLPSEADAQLQDLHIYRSLVAQPLSDKWKTRPPDLHYRIVPGSVEQSALIYRMRHRGNNDETSIDQMPPLATMKVDTYGVQVVSNWIESLPPEEPEGD